MVDVGSSFGMAKLEEEAFLRVYFGDQHLIAEPVGVSVVRKIDLYRSNSDCQVL